MRRGQGVSFPSLLWASLSGVASTSMDPPSSSSPHSMVPDPTVATALTGQPRLLGSVKPLTFLQPAQGHERGGALGVGWW